MRRTPLFERVVVVGLGLIGGSLGLAIRRRKLAREVVGVSRRRSTLRLAARRGAIDVGTTDLSRAVHEADLIILCTPVETIVSSAARLAPSLRRGSIVTDVGSTKAQIVGRLERALGRHVAFVGGHPLAGSERRGIGAADPRLFDEAVCILTPTPRTPQPALRRVTRLWKRLACQVVTMSPRRHDRLLAGASHLPHLLANCLVRSVSVTPLPKAPPSFLEMTRIAKSDPDLWDDIVLSNRPELLAAMDRFDRHWHALRRCLSQSRRTTLRRLLASAQTTRQALQDD